MKLGAGAAIYDQSKRLSSVLGSLNISLTSPATFEHLELNIRFDNSFNNNLFHEGIHGTGLDNFAFHPAGSRLQRVDININYRFHYDSDVDEVEKAVLNGLPLLRTKGILFVKAVSR